MNKIYFNILKKEIKKLLTISMIYNYQNELEYKLKKQYINICHFCVIMMVIIILMD